MTKYTFSKGCEFMIFRLKRKKTVRIEHIRSGRQISVCTGYSWKLCLFSFMTLLHRRDWRMLFLSVIASFFLSWWLRHLVHPIFVVQSYFIIISLFYNQLFLRSALRRDWIPSDAYSRNRLYEKGLVHTHCYELRKNPPPPFDR